MLNLNWDNTSDTISVSNFVGSGSSLTNSNVGNAATGTLAISSYGIGTTRKSVTCQNKKGQVILKTFFEIVHTSIY